MRCGLCGVREQGEAGMAVGLRRRPLASQRAINLPHWPNTG